MRTAKNKIKHILLAFSMLNICSMFAKPVFKVGIMSDTHVTGNINSCSILKDAFELFKQHNVELIINAGDIAESYDPEAYRNYIKTFNSVFADTKNPPKEIFSYAYHDVYKHPNKDPFAAFKDVRKHLEIKHAPYDIVRHKGYVFLSMPQYHTRDEYRKQLDIAAKEHGNKPFFIVDHVAPHGTVASSMNGNYYVKTLLDKYPDAIHISGHNHSLLTNELNIWQGNFTAINAGFLHGSMRVKKSCDVALIMEVYKDKIILRRYFTDTKKEYKSSSSPWVLRLPFDKKTALYSEEYRLKTSPTPEFAETAEIKVNATDYNVKLDFPHASPAKEIHEYKITLSEMRDGKYIPISHSELAGPFADIRNIKEFCSTAFSIGYFDIGKSYQVKITPVHFSGKEGKPLVKDFEIKNKSNAEVIFESFAPMTECQTTYGIIGEQNFLDANKDLLKDGYFHIGQEKIALKTLFPAHFWNSNKRYRIIFDAQIMLESDRSMHLQMRSIEPRKFTPEPLFSKPGNTLNTRYVLDTPPFDRTDYKFYLNMKNGGPGKVKINYIRIERY